MKNWLDLGHWDIFHGFLIASFDCFGSGFINSLMGWSFLSDLKSTMLRSFEEQWTRSRIGACHWLLLAHSCENWKLVSGHPDITNPNESRKLFSWMRWFFSLRRRSTSYVSVVVATHKPPQIQKDALPIRKRSIGFVTWTVFYRLVYVCASAQNMYIYIRILYRYVVCMCVKSLQTSPDPAFRITFSSGSSVQELHRLIAESTLPCYTTSMEGEDGAQ